MRYLLLALALLPNIAYADNSSLECLALNIYHEARGESMQGQLAVAHVTLNRARDKRFPNTVCGVVYQAKHSKWWKEKHDKLVPLKNKCQFSWYCDGRSDEIKNEDAWTWCISLAQMVLQGDSKDPTHGAVYYYNPAKATPYWRKSFKQVAMVDNHVFLK